MGHLPPHRSPVFTGVSQGSALLPLDLPGVQLSAGEVYFLWHFIQGSIMIPDTRRRLRRAWGLCARHSAGFIAAEAIFRHGYLHGPAVLYEDLMERAHRALGLRRPAVSLWAAWRIRATGPCLMCQTGYTAAPGGYAPSDVLDRIRHVEPFLAFVRETLPLWSRDVCGRCRGDDAPARCRAHLLQDLLRGRGRLREERERVVSIAEHVRRYATSFRWGFHGTDTPADRASLIRAVGWCSGWGPWAALLAGRSPAPGPR